MYKKILVPIDGSTASRRSLAEAVRLAKATRAHLRLLHVVSIIVPVPALAAGPYMDNLPRALRATGAQLLQRAQAQVRKQHVATDSRMFDMVGGRAADVIVEHARRWGADLIVMGTHGRTGLTRLALGSDAERVVRSARAPVLVVHPRGNSRAA